VGGEGVLAECRVSEDGVGVVLVLVSCVTISAEGINRCCKLMFVVHAPCTCDLVDAGGDVCKIVCFSPSLSLLDKMVPTHQQGVTSRWAASGVWR
jgi:hypothetical protein